MLNHDLPAGIPEWIAHACGGEITRLERHTARREAWLVDVTCCKGGFVEGFLRLERTPVPDNPWSLEHETRIVDALRDTNVPVPRVLARDAALACTLFERVRGRSDLQNAPPHQQRPVMEHFFDIVADLHNINIDRFSPSEFPRPTTARDCALREMDLVTKRWARFLSGYHDPLITYGIDWLERFVPTSVSRVSLVQGDTGPANFLFEGNRVTSVIDWEWGHLGDPMEDLGNICVREFWNPSGGLLGLLERYQRRSGLKVNLEAVRYYRVQQNMRGMIPIAERTVIAHSHEPLAWYLAYRYIGDRSTLEAMAESTGITLEKPEMPKDRGAVDPLAAAAEWANEHDVRPAITSPFAKSRSIEISILVKCMERVQRFGKEIQRADLAELSTLLGRSIRSARFGNSALDTAIRERRLEDERLIGFLGRRAYRLEWLYSPVTQLYPNRRWAPLCLTP
jgi:aminoglycoside phosphotransferase (APT) family kinase protein